MFFLLLCFILWALFATDVPFDRFGWLMVVGFAWFLGFMDGRHTQGRRNPFGSDRTMPPDVMADDPHDTVYFKS